jgi:ribosomal protein S18 acetylase RimI-like enzyme
MEIKKVTAVENSLLNECASLMASSEPWIILQRDWNACRQSLEGDFREVYVALENEKLIGLLVLQMKGTFSGYLQSICVSPEFRNRGVGKKLLRFAEEHVFKTSPNFFLCVSDFNSGAVKLYEQSGFEKIGVLKNFVQKGFDEILMRKTIASWTEFKN